MPLVWRHIPIKFEVVQYDQRPRPRALRLAVFFDRLVCPPAERRVLKQASAADQSNPALVLIILRQQVDEEIERSLVVEPQHLQQMGVGGDQPALFRLLQIFGKDSILRSSGAVGNITQSPGCIDDVNVSRFKIAPDQLLCERKLVRGQRIKHRQAGKTKIDSDRAAEPGQKKLPKRG